MLSKPIMCSYPNKMLIGIHTSKLSIAEMCPDNRNSLRNCVVNCWLKPRKRCSRVTYRYDIGTLIGGRNNSSREISDRSHHFGLRCYAPCVFHSLANHTTCCHGAMPIARNHIATQAWIDEISIRIIEGNKNRVHIVLHDISCPSFRPAILPTKSPVRYEEPIPRGCFENCHNNPFAGSL